MVEFYLLTYDGPQRARLSLLPPATLPSYNPACGHEGSSHLSPVLAHEILSRCKFSTLTTRQPMVVFYLLTYSRFPKRKSVYNFRFSQESKLYHDFRTSRCMCVLYLLDHSGDEGCALVSVYTNVVISVSVQYNGGSLPVISVPDIIIVDTRLTFGEPIMWSFCVHNRCSTLNVSAQFPSTVWMLGITEYPVSKSSS